MTIGTLANARRALAGEDFPYSRVGTSREVYLFDNVIYKVDIEAGSNDAEWNNYIEFSTATFPPHIAIPKMSRYEIDGDIVLAAEFIDGIETGECLDTWVGLQCPDNHGCLDPVVMDEMQGFIIDLAWGNVIVSNGRYYLVDIEQ